MTWAPGEPQIIRDCLAHQGELVEHAGAACFNLYRPPTQRQTGNALAAAPWLDHLRNVYPDEADHIICWFAHRVQHPAEKINHALVLGGAQGIGKDTILAPLKEAVGSLNFQEISPQQVFGRFNGFMKSAIVPHQKAEASCLPEDPSAAKPPLDPHARGDSQSRSFDYTQLPLELAGEAQKSAERIRSFQRKFIIEIGLELLEMKRLLGHGHFTDWSERALNFSSGTARHYMSAARAFADKPRTVSVLPPTLIYRLQLRLNRGGLR